MQLGLVPSSHDRWLIAKAIGTKCQCQHLQRSGGDGNPSGLLWKWTNPIKQIQTSHLHLDVSSQNKWWNSKYQQILSNFQQFSAISWRISMTLDTSSLPFVPTRLHRCCGWNRTRRLQRGTLAEDRWFWYPCHGLLKKENGGEDNNGQHILSQRSCGNKMKQDETSDLREFGIAISGNSLCDPKIANSHVRRLYQTSTKTILKGFHGATHGVPFRTFRLFRAMVQVIHDAEVPNTRLRRVTTSPQPMESMEGKYHKSSYIYIYKYKYKYLYT